MTDEDAVQMGGRRFLEVPYRQHRKKPLPEIASLFYLYYLFKYVTLLSTSKN